MKQLAFVSDSKYPPPQAGFIFTLMDDFHVGKETLILIHDPAPLFG